MKRSSSLYVRTSLTILVALFIFMVFASIVVFQYIMQPIAKQAAGDLAAFMVLSSQTWVELSADARPRFEDELKNYHDMVITSARKTQTPFEHHRPFFRFLKQALEERLEQPVKLYRDMTIKELVWAEIPIATHLIHIGFPYNHIGANPPKVIFLLLLGAAVLIFLTSSFLVRRLTQPLEKLAQATVQMGRGRQVSSLQESGAQELVVLTRSFNQMNQRVQQLLDNRNTLLAGISHDLRTPISRIHIALELLEANNETELMGSIRADLDEINQLISQTLELAISNEKALDKLEMLDLNELILSETQKYDHHFEFINWDSLPVYQAMISRTAFQRIFQNLIENAIRYGENSAIKITLSKEQQFIKICISDQGPGIPEQYQKQIFQPFFRLEGSRNVNTGGSGLGLAIVSQLCEIYGWKIYLKSNEHSNGNKGSTFCLMIR
ncbi:MAG: HAMP domain-containing protein [gamma proteobacterium symbiont of Bathyaustriella thionipta]|nr:HAMP domain-containing protein [gamma proteobacterium symbiont of Bathyaustriella thionipta]